MSTPETRARELKAFSEIAKKQQEQAENQKKQFYEISRDFKDDIEASKILSNMIKDDQIYEDYLYHGDDTDDDEHDTPENQTPKLTKNLFLNIKMTGNDKLDFNFDDEEDYSAIDAIKKAVIDEDEYDNEECNYCKYIEYLYGEDEALRVPCVPPYGRGCAWGRLKKMLYKEENDEDFYKECQFCEHLDISLGEDEALKIPCYCAYGRLKKMLHI